MPGIDWARVRADNPLRPHAGSKLQLDVRGATDTVFSDTTFVQVNAEGKWIWSLPRGARILVRGHVGATAKNSFAELPPSVRFFAGGDSSVRGYEFKSLGPVDATEVPNELQGFRTMFTSFHHFSPEQAGAVLQNAVDAGEGIGVFEVTRRAPSTILLTLAWGLLLFLCTPWIRPFRWSRLFWTYLVPIIPLVLLFDGVVSCLRSYRPIELREIVGRLIANDYQWEVGETSGELPVTYLIGRPRGPIPDVVAH